MIRDRKMYVAPTPFGLVNGVAHTLTLLLPTDWTVPDDLVAVGDLTRREAERLIVGYDFDLRTNILEPHSVPNPGAGTEHRFRAWRLAGLPLDSVEMRAYPPLPETSDEDVESDRVRPVSVRVSLCHR